MASTASLLLSSASEIGKLDELAEEIDQAAKANLENAVTLSLLARIAQGRGAEVEDAVKTMQAAMIERTKPVDEAQTTRSGVARPSLTVAWTDYLVARAASCDATLAPLADSMLAEILDLARRTQEWSFQNHLNRDLVIRQTARSNASSALVGTDPGLALWRPVTASSYYSPNANVHEATWVESEGIVTHLTGSSDDMLMLDVPLAGEFEFSVDAFDGGWSEGEVAYGGLFYQAMASPMVSEVATVGRTDTFSLTCRNLAREAFNRWTIQVKPGSVRVLVNGHLFHEELSPSGTSPWLALFTKAERQSAYRNARITGSPTIPREINLVHGDRFEGWVTTWPGSREPRLKSEFEKAIARALGNPQHSPSSSSSAETPETYLVWTAKDGELTGHRALSSALSSLSDSQPSRIAYHRPMHDRDIISYEFLYEPGQTEVHPMIGRTEFLIEPEGCRLRWFVPTTSSDWTGLEPSNTFDVPGAKPKPIPLKPGEWNRAEVRMEGDRFRLAINGESVLDYPLSDVDERTFGLAHDRVRTSAKVRKITLRGDWPEELPEALRSNLFARRDANTDPKQAALRESLIDEKFLALQAEPLVAAVETMSAADRYDRLAAWVLPSGDHRRFRLFGFATPTNPPVLDSQTVKGLPPRSEVGGEIDSPAARLVSAAKDASRLDRLRDAVESVTPRDDRDRKDRAAMRAMILAAQGKDDDARTALADLKTLAAGVSPKEPATSRWAELIAPAAVLQRPALREAALGLLTYLVEEQVQKSHTWGDLGDHVRHARALALRPAPSTAIASKTAFWSPVTHATAQSRASGSPRPLWTIENDSVRHDPGHLHDYLYFHVPMQGNFEVECDLSSFNYREARLAYAGRMTMVSYQRDRYELWQDDRQVGSGPIHPPMKEPGDFYPFKIVVKDGRVATFADGQPITDSPLPSGSDPWLAIYVRSFLTGGVRNLKIVGTPEIPESLTISAGTDLSGWLADYYGETLTGDIKSWEKRGDEIYGRRTVEHVEPPDPRTGQNRRPVGDFPGSKQESVLQYHRPMIEDGEISYEFFYDPEKTHVHPAIDRLAILIQPEGVATHTLTDGPRDRSGLSPGNIQDAPTSRRGPERPSLRPREWNRATLSLKGDVVSLAINGTEVFEQTLEPTNARTFGLFHYADETDARVRNVRYRGDWPRSLPQGNPLAVSP